jgi:hypothetical protein
MKNKAIQTVKKTECIQKLAEMTRLTPVTLLRFAEGKRELKAEQVQAIVAEGVRQEMLTGQPKRRNK